MSEIKQINTLEKIKALIVLFVYGCIIERFWWWRYGRLLDRYASTGSGISQLESASSKLDSCIKIVDEAGNVFDRKEVDNG